MIRLQALIFSLDDRVVKVLRRVLSDLEISSEYCDSAESAVRKLTRQRFEAIIVDCDDEAASSLLLKSVHTSPANKRAVAVAIIDGQKNLRSAFELGAHFVLYKPISAERARSSFRAVRALMKCERRRNTRLPMQLPVTLLMRDGSGQQRTVTSDIGEGGIAVQLKQPPKSDRRMQIQLTLPGEDFVLDVAGEVAWETANRQTGIRFLEMSSATSQMLKQWVQKHSPDAEQDDPPVPCKLTDLSLGGCFLEISNPFPSGTKLLLSMTLGDVSMQVGGVVRVMYPDVGMGVEFSKKPPEEQALVEKFIETLTHSKGTPSLTVQPEGLQEGDSPESGTPSSAHLDDPLLDLFRRHYDFTVESFLSELRTQRGQGINNIAQMA